MYNIFFYDNVVNVCFYFTYPFYYRVIFLRIIFINFLFSPICIYFSRNCSPFYFSSIICNNDWIKTNRFGRNWRSLLNHRIDIRPDVDSIDSRNRFDVVKPFFLIGFGIKLNGSLFGGRESHFRLINLNR